MIGKTISHYKILEKLGEGGMGVVYKAQDTKLDRIVALKFLPPHLITNDTDKARFIQEAKAAAATNHPNVCTIFDIQEYENPTQTDLAGKQQFIVMEYVEGQTLREVINTPLPRHKARVSPQGEKQENPPSRGDLGGCQGLPIEITITYAIQIAEALQAAHEQGIIHRDIKSENIMVNTKNQIKVMDFGLAKLKGSLKLTKTNSTVGTLAYSSPEQIQGQKVDARSDIFSFGVVLYEMLSGHLPFKGEYESALIYSILNEEPEPIQKICPDISSECLHVLSRTLEKNPNERYQHIAEVLTDLKSIQNQGDSEIKRLRSSQIIKTKSTRKKVILFGGLLVPIIVLTILYYLFMPSKPFYVQDKSIAVLPFENLSDDKSNEYFSDGVTEDIIAQLTKIENIKVIGRTSVKQYKGTTKGIHQIGKELGVSVILEGSVRRAANRIRIVSQLVEAQSETHIWAETYDRNLNDVFAIQSDVALQIANALRAALSPQEKKRIQQKPTDNPEAYDYYLQARNYEMRSHENRDILIAIGLYQKAIGADSNFAEAYARLAYEYLHMYWWGYNRSQERLIEAKKAIDKALNLKPHEPVVREANGYYYYWGLRDYAKALDEFSFCLQKEPGNGIFNVDIAAIQRRQGKFEEAIENLKIAFNLEPQMNTIAFEIGLAYYTLYRYKEAETYFNRAISLAPDLYRNYHLKALLKFQETGNTRIARQVIDEYSTYGNAQEYNNILIFFDVVDRNFQNALDRLELIQEEVYSDQLIYNPKDVSKGFIYTLMEKEEEAQFHFMRAQKLLERKLLEWPDDARIHAELGYVYAYLGEKDKALQEGLKAVELIPISLDALNGPKYITDLARIYTIIGDHEKAIDKLEYLLVNPSGIEIHINDLKKHPEWDPLRQYQRFQDLLKEEP